MTMFPRGRGLAALIATTCAALLAACGSENVRELPFAEDPANPEPGTTAFVSADDSQGNRAPSRGDGGLDAGAPSEDEGAGGDGDRTVEEGDVYRTFGSNKLLNLNAYRGLQVIDLANLSQPAIVGRLEMSGTPVELYVSGDRAYVLMNDWRGYWGSREDVAVETFQGGVVLSVDLSDPANPTVVDREVVPGWIYKSRLVKGGGQESLYVVAQEYGYVEDANGTTTWTTSTRVKSFGIAAGAMTTASELDLGGWIIDISATPEALLVARQDWYSATDRSMVSIVDISNPDGTMIEGDEILVEGRVRNQFNMDLRGDVLRVVSGSTWGSGSTNHIETFDATDPQNLVRIDHETFGSGQDLYATLFLDEAGFFVTYQRVDPFHAFEITAAGDATERAEFVVSGWNDFFRATFDDTRLVGIGTNDQGGRTMAVSLYDVTNLANPNPLITRAEVQADHSWSEASWDHRAFSVLEGAVAVQAADGTIETGLVLLPFTGWNANSSTYQASVQVFTFSESTLTRRGVMNHGSPVNRSFRPAPGTAANLSQEELSLFDIGQPDTPVELSRLDLAPNYTDVIAFGAHAVRLKEPNDWYRWYWGNNLAPRPAVVQVIGRNAHPDSAAPVASFEVPAGSSLYKVGANLLAAVRFEPVNTNNWPYTWETTVQVFDLTNPASPQARGTLTTQQIQPSNPYGYYYDYGMVADCFDCGGYYWGYGAKPPVYAVGNALAFVEYAPKKELLGTEHVCQSWPRNRESCYGQDGCTMISGYETCRTLNGRTSCYGGYAECTWDAGQNTYDCTPIDASQVDVEQSCWDHELERYWSRFEVEVVDLRQPDAPQLGNTLAWATNEEAVSVLANGSDLWLTYKQPYVIPGDNRPYVRFFSRRVGLANPASPQVAPAVNLPGQLLAVDGNTVFTRDQVWGQSQIEAAVARLQLTGAGAVLEAHRRFADQVVDTIALDGAGHVLVSHRAGWYYGYGVPSRGGSTQDEGQKLTLLSAASSSLAQLASTPVDSWAQLKDARAGRALFQVPGGLLVFNLDTPTSPWPQAYFATKGWPQDIVVDGRKIVFAAGRYGVYEFDLDESNLTPAP